MLIFSYLNAEQLVFDACSPSMRTYGKVKCQLLCLGDANISTKVGEIMRQDLEFTDQLEVDVKKTNDDLSSEIITKMFDQGISIYCSVKASKGKINLLAKDTSSNRVIMDKIFTCDTNNPVACANYISSVLLPELTGEKAITLHDLAYCKLLNTRHKVVCVSNYDAKNSRVVASMNTINIMPCWHNDKDILFYSQLTRQNTRLMAVDVKTRGHKVICGFEGLNMQPSVSKDGKRVVLCLSVSGNAELYLYDTEISKKKGHRVFKPLTKNGGNNVSPCLLENGDVIFCSDFRTGVPQIFYLDAKGNQTRQLTQDGYCAKPSYCAKTNSIVFTKPVDGTFQLFRLALNEDKLVKSEEQLTFNEGDKHEPSWSECGKYVVFSYRVPDKNKHMATQIAVLNSSSGKIRVLTSGKEPKSFPTWRSRQA